MIPVSLTIKGLYSYQSEQNIDFQKLTDAQLFGIFGTVGSGKSSILEAISFALFNKTERLNSTDNRNYNMLNLKSNDLLIDFIFLNHDNETYRFTVKGTRNKKNFDDVKSFERKAYKKIDHSAGWQPIADTDAEQIIGLSYDNFRRTIIIPQDKFQEFLQLGNKDRTKMLKEIFQLDKYEFYDQASALYAQNENKLQLLQGRLEQLGEISLETLDEKNNALQNLKETFDRQKSNLQQLEETLKEITALKKQFDERENKIKLFQELETQRPEIETLKEKIRLYEYCLIHFKELLEHEKELKKSQENKLEALKKTTENLDKLAETLEKEELELVTITEELNKIDDYQREKFDYENLIEYLNTRLKIEKSDSHLSKVRSELRRLEDDKKGFENSENTLKNEILELKTNLLQFTDWANVQSWFVQQESIKKQISDAQDQHEKLVKRLKASHDQLPSLIPRSLTTYINSVDFEQPESILSALSTLENANSTQLKNAQNKLAELQIQSKLAAFTAQIHEGQACPLCGSKEHPEILHIESVEEEIKTSIATINQLDKENSEIRTTSKNLEKTLVEIENIKQQLNDNHKIIQSYLTSEEEHLKLFVWTQFTPSDKTQFDRAQQTMLEKRGKLNQLENQLIELEQNHKTSRERFDKGKEHLNEKETEHKILLNHVQQIKSKIQTLKESAFVLDTETAREKLKNIIEHIDKTIQTHKALNTKNQANKIEFASIQSKKTELEKSIDELKLQHSELQNRFLNSVLQSPFTSVEEIEAVLLSNLNLEHSKNKLNAFENEHFSLQKDLKSLDEALQGKSLDFSNFELLNQQFQKQKAEFEELNNSVITAQTLLNTFLEQWETKKAVQLEYDALENRKTNLKTFLNLFKTSGFVNYISSVYLEQLCEAANDRFHRLTRQQLRLEVAENNTFQVRDFLNEGRVRSVKTLSGGQTFQASLCLALALAENIPQQSKARQNFFFLDEGFGSQDKESLRVVFDSLKALRKENRIVGIISHVEELKQEIDNFLLIANDPEHGSVVHGNWN